MMDNGLYIGQKVTKTKRITEEIIDSYASVTEDYNPLHIDDRKAAEGPFGRRIVHGIYSVGLISGIIGMQLPGEGTIYLEQDTKFIGPIFIGDTISITVEIKEVINTNKGILRLGTSVTNQDGVLVIDGYAVVKTGRKIDMKG